METLPSEALRGLLKPLLWVPAAPIELPKDLRRDDFSAKFKAIPTEARRFMPVPFC